jgi:hypothetical protein
MIKPTVSLINKQQVEQAMKSLATRLEGATRVLVGVPVGAGSYEDGNTIATIAAVNNFGSEDGHIPARPFLAPAIDKGAPQYRRLAQIMLPKVLSGDMTMLMLMNKMGNLAQDHVKKEIIDLRVPANAASTIAKKGADNPLIDTGNAGLLGSIRYVIDDSAETPEEGL